MRPFFTLIFITGVTYCQAQQAVSNPLLQNNIQSSVVSFAAVTDTNFVILNSLNNWTNAARINNSAHELTGQYVLKNRLGLYGQVSNDNSGRYRLNSAQFGLSRAVRLGDFHVGLGLGMKLVGVQMNASALQLYHTDDPSFPSGTIRARVFDFKSDFSIGNNRFIAGAQINNLLGQNYGPSEREDQNNHLERNLLVFGGGTLFEKEQWRGRAFGTIYLAETSRTDFNAALLIDLMRVFQLGLSHQLNGPMAIQVGLNWNKLQFSYAYRMPYGKYALPATHALSLSFGLSRIKERQ